MAHEMEIAAVLWRLECGTSYAEDADTLRRIITQFQTDILVLTKIIEERLDHDSE